PLPCPGPRGRQPGPSCPPLHPSPTEKRAERGARTRCQTPRYFRHAAPTTLEQPKEARTRCRTKVPDTSLLTPRYLTPRYFRHAAPTALEQPKGARTRCQTPRYSRHLVTRHLVTRTLRYSTKKRAIVTTASRARRRGCATLEARAPPLSDRRLPAGGCL